MSSTLQKIDYINNEFSQDKLDLLKNTVCKGSSNDEFQLFLHVCKKTGLDPFMKQIYSIPRAGQRTIQTSIDGLRLIAERTTRYSPGRESTYVYKENGDLISATSYIKKMTADGTWHDVSATAYFEEYNQPNNPFWKKMKHVMIAKCSEAIALKKAFPAEMSGVYSDDEMNQADVKVVKIEDKIEDNISKMQAFTLERQLNLVPDYKDQVMTFLYTSAKICDLEKLSVKLYDRINLALQKKIAEKQKLELNEAEVSEIVQEEEIE